MDISARQTVGAAIMRRMLDICIFFALLGLLVKQYAVTKLEFSGLDRKLAKGQYSYIGTDYPDVWPIEVARVAMPSEETVHFDLISSEGAVEWSALVPGSGVVHLGQHRAPFTLSMFHQLQCLNIMREAIYEPPPDEGADIALVGHCMNYLRQMALCRGDLLLEPAENPGQVDDYGVYYCRDWTAVYEAAKENQGGMY